MGPGHKRRRRSVTRPNKSFLSSRCYDQQHVKEQLLLPLIAYFIGGKLQYEAHYDKTHLLRPLPTTQTGTSLLAAEQFCNSPGVRRSLMPVPLDRFENIVEWRCCQPNNSCHCWLASLMSREVLRKKTRRPDVISENSGAHWPSRQIISFFSIRNPPGTDATPSYACRPRGNEAKAETKWSTEKEGVRTEPPVPTVP